RQQHRHRRGGTAEPAEDALVEQPSDTEHHRRHDQAEQDRIGTGGRPHPPREVGDHDEEGALRDVDDPHHAEDERQAAGHQRVDAADQESQHDRLRQLRHGDLPGSGDRDHPTVAPAAGAYCQAGFGLTTLSVVFTSSGSTISGRPLCHWASRKSPFGSPASVQDNGPRMVSTVLPCSHVAIASWSTLPTFSAAACSTCAAAKASAASSAGSAPPYSFPYAATNSGLSGVLARSFQLTV